jgi:peroxiredoxin
MSYITRLFSQFFLHASLSLAIVATGLAQVPVVPPDASTAASLTKMALPTVDGASYKLANIHDSKFTVVCFLGTECPLAQLYGPRLVRLYEQFRNQQVEFLGVSSNQQDSLQEFREYAQRMEIPFPMVKDETQQLAAQLGATRTPEVFIVSSDFTVQYQGRIDDQYLPGSARPEPTQHDLHNAITELLAGRPVANPRTEAVGCLIGRKREVVSEGTVTYCNQIVRVLERNCVECHRSGEIGPFSLTDYDEVVGWGDMMLEVVDQERMPPWHAKPGIGSFQNARHMSQEDRDLLHKWVDSGMPYGDDRQLPPQNELVSSEAKPPVYDVEYAMADRPFAVPAEGTVEYQYFVVDPGFTEDKWVQTAEVYPGNRSVVHHAIVFIRPPDGSSPRGVSGLTAYVPGQQRLEFPAGYARRIPARSKLVFQMHYTPNGKPTPDTTRIALSFLDESQITHEVFTLAALDQEFEIKPHEDNACVPLELNRFPRGSILLGVAPHMHLRGKSFRLAARREQTEELLLDVPHYDFNWQHFYAFTEPLSLDSIDSLNCVVSFDNSQANPNNPAPHEYVTWGDQTSEEMAIAFFEVAEPRHVTDENRIVAMNDDRPSHEPPTDARDPEAKKFADEFFARFDQDGDGVVMREELPDSMRRFGYYQLDVNYNGVIEREDIESARSARP